MYLLERNDVNNWKFYSKFIKITFVVVISFCGYQFMESYESYKIFQFLFILKLAAV